MSKGVEKDGMHNVCGLAYGQSPESSRISSRTTHQKSDEQFYPEMAQAKVNQGLGD